MSSRGLLRSMAIIGSAQAVKIVITIVRAKTVAVLLGPSGTGLLMALNNLRELSSKGAGLRFGSSGVGELWAAKGEAETLSRGAPRASGQAGDPRGHRDGPDPARARRWRSGCWAAR